MGCATASDKNGSDVKKKDGSTKSIAIIQQNNF